jgi:hypothetical protein
MPPVDPCARCAAASPWPPSASSIHPGYGSSIAPRPRHGGGRRVNMCSSISTESSSRRARIGHGEGDSRMAVVKNVGEPCAREPHARFDMAAGGNQTSRPCRAVHAPPVGPPFESGSDWGGGRRARLQTGRAQLQTYRAVVLRPALEGSLFVRARRRGDAETFQRLAPGAVSAFRTRARSRGRGLFEAHLPATSRVAKTGSIAAHGLRRADLTLPDDGWRSRTSAQRTCVGEN